LQTESLNFVLSHRDGLDFGKVKISILHVSDPQIGKLNGPATLKVSSQRNARPDMRDISDGNNSPSFWEPAKSRFDELLAPAYRSAIFTRVVNSCGQEGISQPSPEPPRLGNGVAGPFDGRVGGVEEPDGGLLLSYWRK
jgi:hypothetical protein